MMKLIELILSTKKKLEKSVFTLSISHRDFTTLAKNKSLQLEKVDFKVVVTAFTSMVNLV